MTKERRQTAVKMPDEQKGRSHLERPLPNLTVVDRAAQEKA
jgi:hypothetical protein